MRCAPSSSRYGELTVLTDAAHILKVLAFLRDDGSCKFISFIDICGVDWPKREKRFDVVYHLLSPTLNARVRIKVADRRDHAGAVRHLGVPRRSVVRARGL